MSDFGHTKAIIVAACVQPKTWTELKEITRKADPTLMVHLDDLQEKKIIKKKNAQYWIEDIDYALNLVEVLIKETTLDLQRLLLARAQIEQLRVT